MEKLRKELNKWEKKKERKVRKIWKIHEKKITKHKSGITLVALVVTIVVLLILAGVSINLVLGDNGIVKKAQDAKTKTAEDQENMLKGMNQLADEIKNAIGEKPKVDLSKYKIGDFVNYTYDTAENYVLTSATCGSSSNPTDGIPQTSGLKWRILNIDEASGTVDLVSENPTGTNVDFHGALGYNNGPYLMNVICEAQYSNSALNVKARNISLLDMEKHLTPGGIAERNKYANAVKYGKTKTYTDNYSYYPLLYDGQKGAGVNVTAENASTIAQPKKDSGNDPYEESVEATSPLTDKTSKQADNKVLTVTQTYYNIPINEPNYGDAAKVLRNSNYYWVSARYVYTVSSCAFFGLRYAGAGVVGSDLFASDGSTIDDNHRLRPVVSLPSSLLTGEKTNDAWNLSK